MPKKFRFTKYFQGTFAIMKIEYLEEKKIPESHVCYFRGKRKKYLLQTRIQFPLGKSRRKTTETYGMNLRKFEKISLPIPRLH